MYKYTSSENILNRNQDPTVLLKKTEEKNIWKIIQLIEDTYV